MFQLRHMEDGEETKIMAGPIVGTNMAKGRDASKSTVRIGWNI